MRSTSIVILSLQVFICIVAARAAGSEKAPEPLPFVRDFKPERYLGKWYEVARLPTPIQPADTLAVAEYAAGKEEGRVKVKNSAYDMTGGKLSEIEGQAELAEGPPPGRLLVSFGPVLPKTPNYHVIHVDEDYQYAVVGVPDRRSLWILAREVPITEDSFKSLREIAEKAGFDVSKLLVAPWDKIREVEQDEKGQRANEAEPQKSP